jgi:hypothetical protein
MFKYIHKVSSYRDELRVDLNLNKRQRNYRFKNKVLYIKDQIVLSNNDNPNKYYFIYKYIINNKSIIRCVYFFNFIL